MTKDQKKSRCEAQKRWRLRNPPGPEEKKRRAERMKALRKKSPERYREANVKWRNNNREKLRADEKLRASKHGNLKKYGMTKEDFNTMLDQQGGVCKICRNPNLQQKVRLHVDHCHKTGIVRGLLCAHCNHGLGRFMDDVILLQSAIEYLSRELEVA